MATWRKYFKTANIPGSVSPIGSGTRASRAPDPSYRNFQSQLPEIYVGHPNRTERYNQYEGMDADSEINAALDILAEFCTQPNVENGTVFDLHFHEEPTDNEIKIIKEQLRQWCNLNDFNSRIFKIFRNTLKYGDQVFVRDPETFKLFWTEIGNVTKVIVNEADGKKPEQYVIKDINPNFQTLSATALTTSDTYLTRPQIGGMATPYTQPSGPYTGGSRFSHQANEVVINAEHILHISLTEGLDAFWPFGNSILEQVFKVFKQKELLEDSIIIYRVQRAPERRVFKIDVGNMPTHMAMAFVERVKNEIHQRRIPTTTGGGQSMIDATYNPLCLDLATRIPLLDGRTLTLQEIINEFNNGKENWAYSCNPITGKVVPGLINWAGVTRKNAEVIELTFNNGKTLVCTPDHKIPVFGKGFVEAKDLSIDDNLIAFNTRTKPASCKSTIEYQQVWNHELKSWEWTHRVVGEFFKKTSNLISHKDSDYFNNSPANLIYEDKEDRVCSCSNKNESTFTVACKVISIKKVDNRDTGTITIDGLEQWHNYHTFAVWGGIFVKNSTNEDFFFPVTADGRGSSVDVLPGGQNVGEITDLRFFTNKLFRGLRIPSSYLPTGDDDSNHAYNDGRLGTALIQEWRFNQYCKRLQSSISSSLDHEFKMFMRWRGINIDNSLFELRFNEPQNFAKNRQAEIDRNNIASFTQLEQIPYFSKRFLIKRYLGLTEEEMQENDKLWAEEHQDASKTEGKPDSLRSVGITPGGINTDLDNLGTDNLGGEDMGGEDMGGDTGADMDIGGDTGAGAATPSPIGSTPPAGGGSPP